MLLETGLSLRQPARLALVLMVWAPRPVEGQGKIPTVLDWRQDLRSIVTDIRILHPAPFTKRGDRAFQRELWQLLDSIPVLSDEERAVRAMRLVASLGDGHTVLELDHPRFALWYPVRLQEFADGYFIVTAHESVGDLAPGRRSSR
jgi:hypothetical protein